MIIIIIIIMREKEVIYFGLPGSGNGWRPVVVVAPSPTSVVVFSVLSRAHLFCTRALFFFILCRLAHARAHFLFLFLSPFLYVPYTSAEEEEEEEDEECLKTRFYSTGFGAEREELLLFFFFSLRGFLSSRISPGAAVGNACLRRSPVLLLEMRLCLTQLERYLNILLLDRGERERENARSWLYASCLEISSVVGNAFWLHTISL